MPIDQDVKEVAYKLDPGCWVSYSGKPRPFKQEMDLRRSASLAHAQKIVSGREPMPNRLPRPYSYMSPRDIRDQDECGLHEAKTKRDVSVLLDRIEEAATVQELRDLLAEFVTMQTGIK